MSELHKKLVHKLRDEPFGLESLSEDPQSKAGDEEATEESKNREDDSIEKFYTKIKGDTFPIQEFYTNQNGMLFKTYYSPPPSRKSPILICHHGAASSSMTFCWLAHLLQKDLPEDEIPGIFLYDARGHGDSSMPNPVDFELKSFSGDFAFILEEFYKRHLIDTTIFLIGHSLGGAVLTDYIMNYDHSNFDIKGLAMIDIVEETALRALTSVSHFINRRPKSFGSYSDAVQWHLHSHLLQNPTSAKISVSDLLRRGDDNCLVWKTDISSMSEFWDSWFIKLSDNFMTCGSLSKHKIAKLLVLSGNDTLDKDLIIGQMQGKYQLIVFNNTSNTGHFIQEDIPKQLGVSIMEFVRRNDILAHSSKSTIKTKWGGKINH